MISVSPCEPSITTDPCVLLSDDDVSKMHVFLRNRGRFIRDPFEGSPPRAFHRPADHSTLVDPLDDPSRYSVLIHEVSLLVGLAVDDVYPSPDDGCPLVPGDGSFRVPDILPLTLTPTKSKRINHPADANCQVRPSTIPIFPTITPHPDSPGPSLHNNMALPEPVTPTPRHKGIDGVRPSLSPRWRQGQVFHFEPTYPNPGDLDETFIHPRDPPPKPTSNSPADRCSSLDRLERSLLKLEAHAPRNHRKSQSEERSHHIAQRVDKRPSLPPPRRLKKEQSTHQVAPRFVSRPAHDLRPFDSQSAPRPILVRQHVALPTCPAEPDDEALSPGSFMDMDIPCTEGSSQKRQTSFRRLTNKEKVKSLVRAAKTASRGVIAWGKTLAGSTKSSITEQEEAQSSRV